MRERVGPWGCYAVADLAPCLSELNCTHRNLENKDNTLVMFFDPLV